MTTLTKTEKIVMRYDRWDEVELLHPNGWVPVVIFTVEEDETEVQIEVSRWKDMGEPEQVTVTIEVAQ